MIDDALNRAYTYNRVKSAVPLTKMRRKKVCPLLSAARASRNLRRASAKRNGTVFNENLTKREKALMLKVRDIMDIDLFDRMLWPINAQLPKRRVTDPPEQA